VRRYALWGNLMAGGGGAEWYFGYQHPHNDLNLEDFRSREKMWRQTRAAVEFFHQHLPFHEMHSADELAEDGRQYVMTGRGRVFAVYMPRGSDGARLRLEPGRYMVRWFNPREGGPLGVSGEPEVRVEQGDGPTAIVRTGRDAERDWVVLLNRVGD